MDSQFKLLIADFKPVSDDTHVYMLIDERSENECITAIYYSGNVCSIDLLYNDSNYRAQRAMEFLTTLNKGYEASLKEADKMPPVSIRDIEDMHIVDKEMGYKPDENSNECWMELVIDMSIFRVELQTRNWRGSFSDIHKG